MIGETLGKCRIESLIGSGGMGMVYRAIHMALGVPVAVKVIRPELASSTEALQRLSREAQLVARLRHPNVVRVYDVGEERGHRYIVMELLDGMPLDRFMQENAPLDIATFFGMFQPLAEGMGEAHKTGIVHRDVKPGNIIVVEGQKPVLTDFGIAAAWAADARITREGHVLGTPAYMSPEQARGAREIDGRSDVFSLGMMMFEALTGQLPQQGRNFMELVKRRLNEDIQPVSSLNPEIPEQLSEVISSALVRDPEKRLASGIELAKALSRVSREVFSTPPPLMGNGALSQPTPSLFRTINIPREETEPIVEAVDLRYTALFPVLSAVEKSSTGFGLIVIHYKQQPPQLLLFSGGTMSGAFRWSEEKSEPIDLETVAAEYQNAPEGVVDALSISPEFYSCLETVLASTPSMAGMRAAFVDLLSLFEYLGERSRSGILKVEKKGIVGFITIADGETKKFLCSPWFADKRARRGLVGLSVALQDSPDARFDFYPSGEGQLAFDQTVAEIPLEPETIHHMIAFVTEMLNVSGHALEKQFGLGTKPILNKHLNLTANEFPALLEGLELDPSFSLDPATLAARIESLPQTGRRALVLSALGALVEGRGQAVVESLRSRRKQRKVAKEVREVWSRHHPLLTQLGIARPFEATFHHLASI